MSDNEIREILIQRKREEKRIEMMQRREDIKETVGGIIAWTCWAALGYMMFLGAYMIG
uniref:Uncharacterized protein n=1 Tax=uncultured bacterium Contig643 TaxID=1393602 RepID=W0FKS2_9BACT|nr:hypothetical protein [uncultured bacterium Contig643]